MCPKAGVTHDLTIADASSGTPIVGLMLYRGKNGARPFVIQDYQTLAPRQLGMGELTQAEFPAEVELVWFQENWRAGLGGRIHRLHPNTLALGTKIDATIDGVIKPSFELLNPTVSSNPDAYKPSGFAKGGTATIPGCPWAFVGRDVYFWDYTNKHWDIGTEPQAADVTYHNGVEFAGTIYAACWDSNELPTLGIYKADTDAQWTLAATSAGDYPKYLCKGKSAAGTDLLYAGNFGTGYKHILKFASTNAFLTPLDWSVDKEIGQADSEITALVDDGGTVLVCKTNGVWAFYPDETVDNLTPEFERMAHPDNFRGAFNWNGHILLPLGAGGMVELVGGKLYDVSLKLYAPEQTTLHGRVVAIHGNPTQLFILVQDTTNLKYHLLMAEWVDFEGKADYRWHHMAAIAYTTGTTEEYSALMSEGTPSGATIHNRVLIGVHSSGSSLLPYILPLTTDTEAVSSNDSDIEARTVVWDKNLPLVNARLAAIDFTTTNCSSIDYWTVKYRLEGTAGTWTYFGAGASDSKLTTSPVTLTFPAEATGKKIELQFVPTVATTSKRIEINSFRLKAQLRPAAVKVLPLQVYLAGNMELLNGAVGGRPKLDLAQLESWNTGAPELTVVDARGTSRSMVFLPATMKVQEIASERWRRPEYVVSFLLAAV